jgi:ABC-type phosphate/phosphonate transport system substrate-binding protein
MVIANARMYSLNAATAAAWRTILEWVLQRATVLGNVIDYPAPQPLAALWKRSDLGAVFMCGYPFSRMWPQPMALVAPVPAEEAFCNRPQYCTEFVVRADSSFQQLEDTFGHRLAWTSLDSQSGYNAPRRLLANFAARAPLFASTVGPLITPRRVIEAILSGDADVGPLDSYAHALLRSTEPATAAALRVVAVTPPTPIPLLVAAAGTSLEVVERLRIAFTDVEAATELVPQRATLALRRFAMVEGALYDVLRAQADATEALGYQMLA